jgi:tetratricopeptide (TPR) repeat protein
MYGRRVDFMMGNESKDEYLIRSYLLGELPENELETVEERLMTDREFSKLALVVESILVEDYVEEGLQGTDRENFERLFMTTPQAREQVRFERELGEHVSRTLKELPLRTIDAGPVVKSPHIFERLGFGGHRWLLVGAAILLLVSGIAGWRVFFFKSKIEKGLIALNKAYQEQPIDARVTGLDFPPKLNQRGDVNKKVDEASLKQAEIFLSDQARGNPDSESFHALGRFYLTQGDFNRAIDYFQKALVFKPNDAQIHSDLGAAFLERAKHVKKEDLSRGSEEFFQSREHLDKALEFDPTLREALFNRALLYQEMLLLPEALEKWQEYISKDPSSIWADKAKDNIEAIEKQKK